MWHCWVQRVVTNYFYNVHTARRLDSNTSMVNWDLVGLRTDICVHKIEIDICVGKILIGSFKFVIFVK